MASRGRLQVNPKFFSNDNNVELSYAKLYAQARTSGALNLSNRDLTDVPPGVWTVNYDTSKSSHAVSFEDDIDDSWYNQVALVKLHLAYNKLTSLDDEIRMLTELVVLDVQGNQLTELPEAIGELSGLKSLNISFNKMAALPESITNLTNLVQLLVQENNMTALPPDIGILTNLEHLDASCNQLTSLPQSFDNLFGLRKLNLKSNRLTEIPESFTHFVKLLQVNLSNNRLATLPVMFSWPADVEVFDLRQNRLTQFPRIYNASRLKELLLANNLICEIRPEDLESLNHLLVLDLAANKIKKVPEEMNLLASLRRLDLNSNDISTVPCELGFMENLTVISLDGNPTRCIKPELLAKGTEEVKKVLRNRRVETKETRSSMADQSGDSRTMVHGVDLHRVAQTESFRWSEQKEPVPEALWEAVKGLKVVKVIMEENQMTQIPKQIFVFSHCLTTLDLSKNRITELPHEFTQCDQLAYLDISYNQVSSLPEHLASLTSLHQLMISGNPISGDLPKVIYRMRKLEHLMAESCRITDLDPEALRKMTALRTLDLQSNNIATVPPMLGLCSQLNCLKLEGNCFRVPRQAILSKGTAAILEYLTSRIIID